MLRSPTAVIAALSLAALAACAADEPGSATSPSGSEPRSTSGGELVGPADEGIDGVQAYTIESNTHTEDDLDYELRPPVGGDHFPVPGTCGYYESNAPTDEFIVHDLEHGAVWIAYDPELGDAERTALGELVAQQAKVIATPREGLSTSIVVSSWGRQLALDSVDDPRLMQFVTTYRNSPNAPEPDAACQGAGTPAVASPTA